MNAQESAAVSPRLPDEFPEALRAQMYDHFQVDGGSRRLYDTICDKMGFPGEIAADLLGHFAGGYGSGWEVVDLWSDADAMHRTFAGYVAGAVSESVAGGDERPDVEPEQHSVAQLVVGPEAHRYQSRTGADRLLKGTGLKPIAVVIEQLKSDHRDYQLGCDMIGFPRTLPDGLVVHVAGESADGWRVFDVWHTEAQQRAWYEHVFKTVYEIDPERVTLAKQRVRRIELVRAMIDPRLTGGGWLRE